MASFRIVSTLGPRSLDAAFLDACTRLGQPSLRLNGSHLSVPELEAALAFVRGGPPGLAVTLDLQGDKRRLGELVEPVTLAAGQTVVVRLTADGPGEIPLPHPDMLAVAQPGDRLLLMDGQVQLRVSRRLPAGLATEVERGGTLRSKVGAHLEGRSLTERGLNAEQAAQLAVAKAYGVAALALSYVQAAADLVALREHCADIDYRPAIVAKIERPEALASLAAVTCAADEVWLCRGDLGALLPLRELGAAQARTLACAAQARVPCLVAGQVFHHLTEHPEPTRSEVVHLHDLRVAGAAGIVLSDETAIGRDPTGALAAVVALL